MSEEQGGVSNPSENDSVVRPPLYEKKNVKQQPKEPHLRADYTKMDLRERTIYELKKNLYPCVICLENIKIKDQIWSCDVCFHLLHIKCMKMWSGMEYEVRCPNCNTIQSCDYISRCFCQKISNPSYNHYIPHSCGNKCDKLLKCNHHCERQCHPGPCIPCIHRGNYCYCGKTYMKNTECGKQESCGDPCSRILCDLNHECKLICHPGNCPPCYRKVMCICYCGKVQKEIKCCERQPILCNRKENYVEQIPEIDTYAQQPIILDDKHPIDLQINVKNDKQVITYKSDPLLYLDPINKSFLYEKLPEQYTGSFCCNQICNTPLNCGIHKCQELCHPGECKQCSLIKTCACGKRTLDELLLPSTLPCSSTPPSCGQRCLKLLNCNIHRCQDICHPGPCKICKEQVTKVCRCGQETKTIICGDNNNNNEEYICNNKCGMILKCGIHKCNTICCPYRGVSKKKLTSTTAHCCNEVCGRILNCGKHHCDLPCHSGKCPDCAIAVTDTILKCNCGRTVIKPPYKCGTVVSCYYPCNKKRECGHKSDGHLCHDGDCPPCMELVNKICVGGHIVVPNVICSNNNLRCTNKCGKPLPCGHTCQLQCHSGPCYNDNNNYQCKQPCNRIRKLCGHPCNEPCHYNITTKTIDNCPNTQCHYKVKLQCKCGRKTEEVDCLMTSDETNENLEMKNRNIECDDLCLMIQRSKAFAEAFGIDVKSKVNHSVKDSNSADIYEELLKRTKFPKSLVAWGYNNNNELISLEHQIDIFISSPLLRKKVAVADSLKKSDKEMEELVTNYYNLNFERTGMTITLTKKTDIKPCYPHPLLSETINKFHLTDEGYFPHLNEPKYEKNDPEIKTVLHLYNITTYRPIPSIISPYIPEDVNIRKINHENTLLYCHSQGVATRVLGILSELEPKQFKIRYWGKVNGEDNNVDCDESESGSEEEGDED